MAYKLIACDGGGIRGLITALLIKELDSRYGIIARADGFAGTSTGGLIALALAHGVAIDEVVTIYQYEGNKIFDPNGWLLSEGKSYRQREATEQGGVTALSGPGVFSCEYKNDGLSEIAAILFGNSTLSQCSKFVGVNSARLWEDGSWQPAMLANSAGNAYKSVKLADASLATSAAPTYFPPYNIDGFGYFADGGTYANNPAMAAIGEIVSNGLVGSISDLKVISLGTGQSPEGIKPSAISDPLDWGADRWMWPMASGSVPAMPLLNLALDCTAYAAAVQASQLLKGNFCRANFVLPSAIALDDWKDTAQLTAYTKAYMTTTQWSEVCKWVESNWT